MNSTRLLLINPLYPHSTHSIRSGNVVIFELLREFSRQPGLRVGFLKVSHEGEPGPSEEEKAGIQALKELHVEVLSSLNLPRLPRPSVLRRLFTPTLDAFYPDVKHRKLIEEAIRAYSPDILFVPWTEWVTMLCADVPFRKFAYYGNPDPKSSLALAYFDVKHGRASRLQFALKKRMVRHLERLHLAEIKKYEFMGNVAANDAAYYADHGHPHAFYIQNTWIDRFGPAWREKRMVAMASRRVPMIIGNIGKLSGTANTYGLEILGREVLPILRATMQGAPFEIHIFGSGVPHPIVADLLHAPEIHMRGFVEDIDGEMLASDVFLCLNNGSDYKVGHTRYLHAWSLGCTVIAHRDASLSMPEISHGKNALLGRDSIEITQLITQAIADPSLREKIGEGGYATFREFFTADRVVPKILKKIEAAYEANA